MKLFETLNLLERLDQLIRLKCTGSPVELAQRLELSERHVRRIIEDLREKDIPIAYCKQRKSYYYRTEIILKFQASVIENGKERKIIGGESFFDFFKYFFQTDKK